jgi:hypothetical protein
LSLNDIALAAVPDSSAKPGDVTYEDLALAMKTVSGHRVLPKEETPSETTTTPAVTSPR